MTFEVWAGAALLLALAVLYGRALSVLHAPSWAAGPAVGFAIELIAANIGSELPGLGNTGAVILLVLGVAALAICVLRGPRPRLEATPWIVLAVAVLGTALPFLANGRTGLLGVSLDNDTAAHLIYAAALSSASAAHHLSVPSYYPLAPHALAAALHDGTRMRLDAAFNAFTIATMLVTALVASAALGRERWWRRVVAGIVVTFLYLSAAYYGEDSFKELIVGMLLLGFVVCLEGVRESWDEWTRARWLLLTSPTLLLVAGLYTYGYLALAWFGLTLVLWVLIEAVGKPSRLREWRARWREPVVPVAIVIVAAIVVLLPIANRLLSLISLIGTSPAAGAITVTNTGDLSGKLSPYEALGIWHSLDFRLAPTGVFHAWGFWAFALAVVLFGLLRALVRRRFVLVAGVIACLLVYLVSAHGQSAYVTAKSLTIACPLVGLLAMRGLLCTDGWPRVTGARWLLGAVAAAYVVLALWSSSLALRGEPVWPMTGPDELMSFAHTTAGSSVLVLGGSEYTSWIFDRSVAPAPVRRSGRAFTVPPAKAAIPGDAVDWDNESAATLNSYRWVVTTNSPRSSQPPAAFRLVRRLRMYDLYRRVGTVVPRRAIDTPGAPGAILSCTTPAGRRISRQAGVATVTNPPLAFGVGVIRVGATRRVSLPLPAGRWELSIQYVSGVPVRVTQAGGTAWSVPAYLDGIGPFFAFARVRSYGGLLTLAVHAERPSVFTVASAFLEAQVEAIVATPVPDTRQVVPLRQACGRYVDWYRPTHR